MDLKSLLPADHIREWFHDLHQHPELSHQEYKTAEYIHQALEKIGVDEIVRPTPTSLIATIQGHAPGKTVMFRADIDALPITEETGLPFASKNPGVMHACGHDTHTSILLGTAEVLTQLRNEFAGTVKLLFQHAEEVFPSGAKEIVESGALDGISAGFGMHILIGYPAGSIGIVPKGHVSSNTDFFDIKIRGKGTHASTPHMGIDPIVIAAEIVLTLQTIVSRSIAPDETAVVTIGAIQAGTANNIIPDTASLKGNVRTINPENRAFIRKRVETIVRSICDAHGADLDFEYQYGIGMMVNDPELSALAKNACLKVINPEMVHDAKPMLGSEDFSYYCDEFPCCYFFFSGGGEESGCIYTTHHPKFHIVEEVLPLGTLAQVQILLDALAK